MVNGDAIGMDLPVRVLCRMDAPVLPPQWASPLQNRKKRGFLNAGDT